MPRLRTTMSQFALVAGRRRNHTEMIACREPSRRGFGAPRAHLYLLAEHMAADGHEHGLCPILMREVQLAFVADEAAGAAQALSNAIRAVNRVMWEECRGLSPHKRLPLGLLALAVEGNDAYLCQVTAGQVYLGRGGDCLALPDLAHWQALHAGQKQPSPALGELPEFEPTIHHCRVAEGDWLVLCSTNLARLVDAETLQTLARAPGEVITRLCNLAEEYGLHYTNGMVLQILQTPEAAGAAEPLTLTRLDLPAAAPAAPREAARMPATAPAQMTGELLPQNVVRLYTTPPLAPKAAPAPAPAAAPRRASAVVADRSLRTRWLDALAASLVLATDAVRRAPTPITGAAAAPRPARPAGRPAAVGAPIAPEPVYRASSDGVAAAGVEGFGGAAALRLTSLPWPGWSVPVAIALAVVTAALLLAAGVSSLVQGGYLATVEPAAPPVVQQAREQREAVTQAPAVDTTTARQTLEQLQTSLASAEARPAPPAVSQQIAAELGATRAALDAINRTSRLGPVNVLADLSASGTPATTPKQILAGGGNIYVLDPYANTLYLIDENGKAPTALLTKGWTISRQKVDDLVGATWRGDTLVVMDRSRAYTLDGPNGTWRVAPLAAAGLGLGTHRVASFEGNLYVLDSASHQILKFVKGAYNRTPQRWLKQGGTADLTGAIDIAIDGRIYALTAAGQILTLARGQIEKTLTVDVSPAIQTPAALISPPGSPYLYVAEAGGRILKLGKDGTLVRQYRLPEGSTDLSSLSDLWVDATGRTLYAVAGNRVVRVALSQPGGQMRPQPS